MTYRLSDQLPLEFHDLPASARITAENTDGVSIVTVEPGPGCSRFSVEWQLPQDDIQFRWVSAAGKIGEGYPQFLPPDWFSAMTTELCRHAPVFSLVGADSGNRLTAAVSESVEPVLFRCGVSEETFMMQCRIECTAVTPESRIVFRFDQRRVPFSESLREVAVWWENLPGLRPMPVPASAFDPVYSTWYSYHHGISADAVGQEVKSGLEYGMKTVIVDDGWQKIGRTGSYPSTGDWLEADRFPDMKQHVRRIRETGVRYLLWVALPFIGEESRVFPGLKDKLLYFSGALRTWILDPRFPEVRNHLVSTCVRLVKEWELDGLKLDFLDRFPLPAGIPDPADCTPDAGRDCPGVDEGVNLLLDELTARLRAVNPDVLIEFRQDYIAPAMRKYANIFRASDCPGDRIANRRRIINLRLLSGGTAVHSDMLGWSPEEAVESAARQLWNIVFSVPQLSVRLADLPEKHRRMLAFFLNFWTENRTLFLHSGLTPLHPELNYPLVMAENGNTVAAVLYSEQALRITGLSGRRLIVINATASPELLLQFQGKETRAEIRDCCGNPAGGVTLRDGIRSIAIPPSGVLVTE